MTTAKNASGRDYAFGTLMNFGYVAGRVETSRRREVLSWSHHYEVAALKPEQQERWLTIAVQDGLSVAKLRQRLYEDQHPPLSFSSNTHNYRMLCRLIKNAKIDPHLFLVFPWQNSEFEHYLATHKFFPPQDHNVSPYDFANLFRAVKEANDFWSKTAEFVLRIASKNIREVARESNGQSSPHLLNEEANTEMLTF